MFIVTNDFIIIIHILPDPTTINVKKFSKHDEMKTAIELTNLKELRTKREIYRSGFEIK